MKEENKASKNKWSAIFKKKWFLPSMYLVVAALLLSVVVWYQNVGNQVPEAEDTEEHQDEVASDPFGEEDAESVMDQQEVIKMPVVEEEQAEIVTKFYDSNAEEKDQENALILYNNRFHQSTGIDIAAENGETFDATASLSGKVKEVKEDPLLGNVVILDHENDITTYYSSLNDVQVKAGASVKQGDLLGVAGKNVFGKDNGTHVHFELRKKDQEVNPEDYFNQPMTKLDSIETNDADETVKDYDENNRSNELDGLEESPFGPGEDADEDLEDGDDEDKDDSEDDEHEENEDDPSNNS